MIKLRSEVQSARSSDEPNPPTSAPPEFESRAMENVTPYDIAIIGGGFTVVGALLMQPRFRHKAKFTRIDGKSLTVSYFLAWRWASDGRTS